MSNRKHEVCAQLRNLIVSDFKESYRYIAQKYNIFKSKICKKYLEI